MKVSIIVPIYKVEKYLAECVDSLLCQTYRDLEIILVDDGSPDACGEICDNYRETDERIKVLHKENGGQSSARNAGLGLATGEYVLFMDSDDYLLPNAVEILAGNIHDLDFIHYSGINFADGRKLSKEREESYIKKNTYCGVYQGHVLLKELLTHNDYAAGVPLYLYRRSFLTENHLTFYEGILHEDEEFTARAFLLSEKCAVLPLVLYMRRVREDSIMGQRIAFKNTNGMYHAIRSLISYDEESQWSKKFGNCFCLMLTRLVKEYYARLAASVDRNAKESKQQTRELESVLKDKKYYGSKALLCYVRFHGLYVFLREKKVKDRLRPLRQKLYRFEKLDSECKSVIRRLRQKTGGRIIVLCVPHNHSNRGDIAISLAQRDFIEKYFPDRELIEIPTRLCKFRALSISPLIHRDDILLVCGGGWFGSLWRHAQIGAMRVLKHHKQNKIIVFPQTVYYSDDETGRKQMRADSAFYKKLTDFHLCVRDRKSYDIVKDNHMLGEGSSLLLLPDMVLTYAPKADGRQIARENKVSVCFRNDPERILDFAEQNAVIQTLTDKFETIAYISSNQTDKPVKLSDRDRAMGDFLEHFRSSRLIVTDRLHCMLFAYVTGTPCIAFDNKTGKVFGVYQWLRERDSIRVIRNVHDFAETLSSMKLAEYAPDQEYYTEKLKEILLLVAR